MAQVLLEESDGPGQRGAHAQCGSITLRALGIPPERSDVPTLLVVGLFTLPSFFTACPSSK